MAFASVGSLGSANTKVAAASLSMNPTSNVPVGHIVVVWTAIDTSHVGGGNTTTSQLTAVTDSVGNIYTCIACGQGHQNPDLTQGEQGIFVSQLEIALATTDTITVTDNAGSTNIPKTLSAWEFTSEQHYWATGNRVGNVGTPAGAPPSLTLTEDVSHERLWLHALGSCGPSTDTYTQDGAFTSITFDGTTGGAADSNETIFGGWAIATGLSKTITVDMSTHRDCGECMASIIEHQEVLAFPVNGILDDFNRADEAPLGGGWVGGVSFPCETTTHDIPLALVSNAATAQAASTPVAGQWWNNTIPGTDQESFATLTTVPTTGGDAVCVICSSTFGGTSVFNGSQVKWRWRFPGNDDVIRLGWTGSLGGQSFCWTFRDMTVGYSIGVRSIGNVSTGWVNFGAGWRFFGGYESLSTQARLPNSQIGLQVQRTVARMDDFGGGPVVAGGHWLPILGAGA